MAGPVPPFDPGRLRARLDPGFPWDLRHVAVTASTNDDARAADSGHGTVFLADFQTAGRGARRRTWQSPPGGSLLASIVLVPDPPLPPAALTALGALALAGGLGATTGLEVLVKWPNDCVIDDRKVGGVLVESSGGRAVVGLGANLNFAATEILEPDYPATTASDKLGAPCDREAVTAAVLNQVARLYGELRADPGALDAAWRGRSSLIDRAVVLETESGAVRGVVVGFSAEGHLRLRLDSGDERSFIAGRVRPAG
ncbi:MAG: biotin--[acetyl-CoA-carboxylase] ligase [Chloroflexota bacterium]|nr:biotin--[acetyl-CoA-carboxylase] ligase [Chloroflexota bacterium]MDP6507586.1 biotin--[acetyl-CoA-carboxylase] ligase [Chloroflexota bacterium]MDP6757390.1 biotin--[acetyl-CoA-carboxylase] ligase [Chloroflexota bacterium]